MAILATVETRFGTIVDAYCRLAKINWDEPALEMILGLKIFANREAREQNKEPLDIRYYHLPITDALASSQGGNMIAFGYGFMKSMDEFLARGTDV